MKQPELDLAVAKIHWQWHGRQCFSELRNDFRFQRRIRKAVYHLSDVCKATDFESAKRIFASLYPDAQTVSLFPCK